jgi:hypothetical protein
MHPERLANLSSISVYSTFRNPGDRTRHPGFPYYFPLLLFSIHYRFKMAFCNRWVNAPFPNNANTC